MEKLIRIEHPKSGKGMWRHNVDDIAVIRSHSNYNNIDEKHRQMPGLYVDNDLRFIATSEHFCAYNNMQNLERFLSKEDVQELIALGFNVLELTVKECHRSNSQAIFLKTDVIETTIINSQFNH